jgi:hypothetical protein
MNIKKIIESALVDPDWHPGHPDYDKAKAALIAAGWNRATPSKPKPGEAWKSDLTSSKPFSSQPRTEISRRAEGAQIAQRQMWGERK